MYVSRLAWALGLGLTACLGCGRVPRSRPVVRGTHVALLAPTRGDAIPIGIENVNDSPLKDASYRALLRFVPDTKVSIDRFYFGFKLRGADCEDAGQAGYGAGDGGTLEASLVEIDAVTGLPGAVIDAETINGCTRHDEAMSEIANEQPVLIWVNVSATLEANTMYGLVVRNTHDSPADNFFSFNMPLADTELAGPHARNELDPHAKGAILSLDPREHVAWSEDDGKSWHYGSANGQYRSYMNNDDQAHPATRMPQYGWRRADGVTVAQQPYYAYNDDCTGCSVTYANARYARVFTLAGGFIASGDDVGMLTVHNLSTDKSASCTPDKGYGFRTCTLVEPIAVDVGEDYTVSATGLVEIMRLDYSQRLMFPNVGTRDGELRSFQAAAAPGTNEKDVPNLWAGPTSAQFPSAMDEGSDGDAGAPVMVADASSAEREAGVDGGRDASDAGLQDSTDAGRASADAGEPAQAHAQHGGCSVRALRSQHDATPWAFLLLMSLFRRALRRLRARPVHRRGAVHGSPRPDGSTR